MADRFVDLHLHTNRSDGSDEPRRVVERAAEKELAAIAVTDHDTLAGVSETQAAGRELGVEVLRGVEISSRFGKNELHILGLGVSLDSPELNAALKAQVAARDSRAEQMVERLKALDVPVTIEKIKARITDGVIGRMHVAQEVVAVGAATHVQDAFDKYIKAGRPAYVPKEVVPVEQAVELIHTAGGLAFVAHPGLGKHDSRLESIFKHPFDGIEAYHTRHTPAQRKKFLAFAESRDLLVSGGSDCHGTIKGEAPLMGRAEVPFEVYARIRDALAR